ncbi:putative HAD superfamily protein [Cryptosporidium felis]|nr:putative HAD superfamily protein [Cryptosporidium felis]
MWGKIVNSVSSVLDINQATLSGCIDIIVVPQADGTLQSTPFHVRFGKAKLLKSREKIVSINVNGNDIPLKMKLGAAGEAYFIHQDESPEDAYERLSSPDSVASSPSDIETNTIPQIHESSSNHLSHARSFETTVEYRNKTENTECSVLTNNENGQNLLNIFQDHNIALSLCGHLLYGGEDDAKHDEYVFQGNIVSFEQFEKDPNLWYHSCLVATIGGGPPYYPIKAFYPVLTSIIAFGRPPSAQALKKFLGIPEKSSKKIRSSSDCEIFHSKSAEFTNENFHASRCFSSTVPLTTKFHLQNNSTAPASIDKYEVSSFESIESVSSSPNLLKLNTQSNTPDCTYLCSSKPQAKYCRHSLRPTSEQLKSMRLKWGSNRVTYTVESSLQGKKTVSGTIYLWPPDSRIVVSDVDGTITRSDVLGQLMPIVGRDWSHQGVAELMTNIESNGYKIVYLTARAIGQADATRDFLFGLKQMGNDGNVTLPDGPVFLSPDRLFPSFKREVIDRKPYIFKIAALRDIRNLFPVYRNPLYAGFGNRDTDYRSYSHVGIPEGKIFIIDPKGVIHHINRTYAKTYETLSEIVEYMFPPLADSKSDLNRDNCYFTEADDNQLDILDDQYNSFNYWRIDPIETLNKALTNNNDNIYADKSEMVDVECGDIEDNVSDSSINIDSYKTATAISNCFSSIDASEIISNLHYSHTIDSIIEDEL